MNSEATNAPRKPIPMDTYLPNGVRSITRPFPQTLGYSMKSVAVCNQCGSFSGINSWGYSEGISRSCENREGFFSCVPKNRNAIENNKETNGHRIMRPKASPPNPW